MEQQEYMFRSATIIGIGLIGSSVARAIRKYNVAERIIAGDTNVDRCTTAKALGIVDGAMSDIAHSVVGSDLIVICTPVGAYGAVGEIIQHKIKDGAIVTDVGSVKKSAIDALAPFVPDHAHLIPAHPIAGTENSGPEAGFAALFEGRWCIITPLPDSDIRAVEMMTKMWERFGSTIEIMDAAHHDLVLGITSHLPHLIAYTIVHTADELEDDLKAEVIKFSASGFRDFTRIAASDPTMWRDIFLGNKDAVLEVLQRFNEDLTALQKAIRQGDADKLFETFTRTRHIRREIIELGQAEYKTADGTHRSDAA